MKKVLIHENAGDPVYISLSDDMCFHVTYQESTVSKHNSLRSALDSAIDGYITTGSRAIMGWKTLE